MGSYGGNILEYNNAKKKEKYEHHMTKHMHTKSIL